MPANIQPQDKWDSLSEALQSLKLSGRLNRVKLDRIQVDKWVEARSGMLFSCPMFTHILYEMLVPDNAGAKEHLAFFTDKVIERAATDGYELFINPIWFFKQTLLQQIFTICHEVLHPVLNHCGLMYMWHTSGKVVTSSGKILPFDQGTMNKAMDFVINDILISAGIGEPPADICWDRRIGTKDDSCVDVYERIYKPGGGGGEGDHPGGDVLLPGSGQGKDPAEAAGERSEPQWQTVVAAAAAAAKAQGKLPAEIEKLFKEVLEPKITWSDYIRSFFARKVGSGAWDWRNPDEELIVRGMGVLEGEAIFAPGRSGFGAGTVVVGMDNSGSIYCDPTLIDRWMGELSGILSDVKPKRTVVIWCDAEVHRVDEAEDPSDLELIRAKGSTGGGGTDFRPVFDEIKKMGLEPDALVYLTDGDGSYPKSAPQYPVLWGNITKGYELGRPYPFGEVITIPTDK